MPQRNQMKANWDAAVNTVGNNTGLGEVIRDAEGEV